MGDEIVKADGRGGDRVETHNSSHGRPGGLASGEIKKKRRKRREENAVQIVDGAFKELQTLEEGIYSLVAWAKRNNSTLTEFYTKIFGKRIPAEVTGAGGGDIVVKIQRL